MEVDVETERIVTCNPELCGCVSIFEGVGMALSQSCQIIQIRDDGQLHRKTDESSLMSCPVLSLIQQEGQNEKVQTVNDVPNFSQLASLVALFKKDGQVHLETNLRAAQRTGLKISSRLLQLATVVRREDRK